MSANTSNAVMASRLSGPESLDLFPTPPWSTRSFVEDILRPRGWIAPAMTAWDPCCGLGHMTLPLRESFSSVFASDVHDWGFGDRRNLDFTFARIDDAPFAVNWIIMNPPFIVAESMLARALTIAVDGVAMLLRLQWLEGGERHRLVYEGPNRPSLLCPFADRVPMIEGVWDPEASTATAYAWFVWSKAAGRNAPFEVQHIRPGAVGRHTKLSDLQLATPGEAERRRLAKKKKAI